MPAVWPIELPQTSLIAEYQEDALDFTLRSEVDYGATQARSQQTGKQLKVMIPLLITTAQKASLKTFYYTTLVKGSLRFEWLSYHTTGLTKEHLFLSAPQFSQASYNLWRTTLSLMIFDLG